METIPPKRALQPLRGLLLLALANLLIWLVWECCFTTAALYSASLGLPQPIIDAINWSVVQSQVASYGIVAALAPRRRFVGLAWATGIGLLLGMIRVATLTVIKMSRYGMRYGIWPGYEVLHVASMAEHTVTMFVLLQALRFACGWRIALADEPASGQRGQFHVGDVWEWTVSVSVWLAINRLIKTHSLRSFPYSSPTASSSWAQP